MNSEVRIYVAYTPDDHMERIEAPCFYNVTAGSVFQTGGFSKGMLRDDTGDNISSKNRSFCELTVQYWAWKNEQADYYGFCHYRRLFSFRREKLKGNDWGVIEYDKLDKGIYPELGMDDKTISDRIKDYDILLADAGPVNLPQPETVYEHYAKNCHLHVRDLELMADVIREKYPELSPYAESYLNAKYFYPFNMFIMKRELFFEYAGILFSILEEVEKRIDMSLYSREGLRTMGHLGERFLGIFFEYVKAQGKYAYDTLQVAVFDDTEAETLPDIRQEEKVFPVVFSVDQAFIPVLGVCLQSLTDTASDENIYEICIFYRRLERDSIRLMEERYSGKNIRIRFVNVTRYVFRYRLEAKEHITTPTYYRCLIPELLPHCSRVLYLDCDIIIKTDIAKLFETELGSCLLGAAPDPDFMGQCNGTNPDTAKYCREVLKTDPFSYFQAGVLLFNVKEFRASFTSKEMFEMADTGIYRYSDQDILNVLCAGRVCYFDMSWNLMYDFDRYRWEFVLKYAPSSVLEEYERARLKPHIIHYAGCIKPWQQADVDYGTDFWEAARRTPYYEVLLQELVRNTACRKESTGQYNERLRYGIKRLYVRLFPEGSRRREWVRKHIVPHAKKSVTDYISIVVE